METPVVKPRGRPRKRRREDAQIEENENCNPIVLVQALGSNDNYKKNENNKEYIEEDVRSMRSTRKRGRPPKRRAVEVKGEAAVGRYVLKEFEGSGVFLGKILSYDSGLYRVDYEDGDFEDLDNDELHDVLIVDERQRFVGDLLGRKKKLDENIAEKCGGKVESGIGVTVFGKVVEEQLEKGIATGFGNVQGDEKKAVVPTLSDHADEEVDESEVDDDDLSDSCSESCEYGQGWEIRSEIEIPAVPPPELPPSSGTVGVPEEYVPHLFSVYGFLRSFSIRLFLSPFTLDDLVGCLNCNVPNTLLDAIHVALLRTLRRHLEAQASDGSELASKCLRCIDWGFLDILTWPLYLVHYLMVMGHLNQKEWKGFYIDVLQKDYCTLSVGMKLTVLQILCDDALDTAEMRAEVDIREEFEVGVESDWITSNVIDNGPRKVYLRSAKTSVGKDMESFKPTAENIIAIGSNTLKGNDEDTKSDYIDEDVNGDECRLCGMDGMLLCCDGCPSAYHSRCIGVNKLSIPEGKWFCHDCKISRVDPPITTGTSLRGAESFGVDPYSQLFLGTCNHLLVLKVSIKASSFVRYYSHNDIPKVIMALCSSPHHAVSYSGICHAILKYWELPQVRLAIFTSNQTFMDLEKKEDSFVAPFTANGNKGMHKAEHEDNGTGLRESVSNHISGFGLEMLSFTAGSDDVSLGGPIRTDISMVKTNGIIMNEIPTNISTEHAENVEQIPTNMSSELGENPERPCVTRIEQDDGFIMTGVSSCTSGNKRSSVEQKDDGYLLPHNLYMNQKEESNRICDTAVQHMKDDCLYMGSIFNPHAYVNNYVHGEFAGCAAANFAMLSSDEKRLPELHASDPRKVMSANVVLQTKAFSSAAVRFFWPSTEKKLVEIPRERCSWCLHCKAPATSKKACLLNQAALNATRAPMKFCSGLKLVKNLEGGLYGIAAYMLYIEESLRGLIVGPFLSASYQKQWCKKVEQASTCNEIKSLLLELEENICTNALLSEWTKLVDNWTDEFFLPQSTCATGSTQKRCTGRRKKHLSMSDNIADDSNDSSRDLNWRNGKLSKLVFQRGTLPSPVLRKAARQGGSRKISGIQYSDSSDVPKRSRQFLWRAVVEMSLNASGLALQVRYLDHHIKWSDLLRPEQSAQDGKGLESEAYAFRSARICDRRVVDSKVMYGVVFGHQKHLSNRLMKSVMEKEETRDGNEKYWFLETRIPLYLIKEYEEHAEKIYLPPSRKPGQEPDQKPEQEPEKMPNQTLEQKLDDKLSEHQKRQLIAFRRSSCYLYLTCKREDVKMCYCASCHQYLYTRSSAKCDACEGFCHEGCVINSTFGANDDVALRVICKQCSAKALNQNNNKVESPTSPLAVQGLDFHNSATVKSARLKAKASSQLCQISATVLKGSKAKSTIKATPSIGTSESYFAKKPKASCDSSSSKKKRSCHWGLIWKKKPDDDGSEFRSKNILFRGTSHDLNLITPECQLCQKPYSPHLMYIRCETCQNWHHADAVELDESKLSSLVGYKCCRCRRIKTPVCPYADKNTKNKKLEVKKIIIRGPKEETMLAADSVSDVAMSEREESLPSTPMSLMEDDVFIEVDDSLLLSVSKVEEIPEPNEDVPPEWNTPFGFGPQKLPVRRQIKNERDDDGLIWSENSAIQLLTSPKTKENSAIQLPTSPETKENDNSHFKCDVFNGGFEDGSALEYEDFDYDNTEYEPQTYFSYTELLDTDDGHNQFGAVDACVDGWENMPCEYLQSGFPEHCDIESFDDLLPAASMDSIMDATCSICLQTAPVPDLVCYSCGLQIHSVCSPGEVVSLGESWRCGSCREWH